MTKIYVAKEDIPARTLIQESQITTMEIPNRFVNKAHVTDKDDLVNKVLVVPLSKEEIITKNMLKPFSNLRNENNRLVAMYPSEKVQFDQVIETLDRVDIIVSTENNGKPKTEIFMRDVPVAFAQGEGEKFAGVALEVSMEDAPKLIHMQNYADKVRVLKANVGKDDSGDITNESQEAAEQAAATEKAEKTHSHTNQPQTKPSANPSEQKINRATSEKPKQ
ncbi:SAF domain-containing protein [Bacillus methanolicus]|uniref:SAF domain-containing protein n=1 Tax=Bacillus methanolicus TaxID=1471 RepID=UPI00237FFC15|nr:SAF domain-containing protein [Bacillus methanolicus]